jgi:hypothetical protein
MAFLPTQGNEIIVDSPDAAAALAARAQPGGELVSWLVGKATSWEDHRNRGYQRLWGEYWRMWRGRWSEQDRNRLSERSRLIAPALAQAIEMTVAEIEEAVFSRSNWVDVSDDIDDEQKEDALRLRDALIEDFETANVKDAVSEAVLNSAIFGTGIVKLNTDIITKSEPFRNERTGRLERRDEERVLVTVESLRPDEFIPDPSGRHINEMLGCFHKMTRPLHGILEKIEQGIYREDALALLGPGQRTKEGSEVDHGDPGVATEPVSAEKVEILEYHGKVPARMLNELGRTRTPLDEILEFDLAQRPDEGDGPLVEAIVTIANGSVLLRAMPNPFVMTDRSIIAFQFEKVPGRFWGRGVAEKGYHPQKALDAELRARADALGFISSPMLGVDSGRIPRGFKMEVKPGKVWLTQGPPRDVLQPIEIGNLNGATFNQTQEMERMVQMGTGAMDTATALRNQTQSGGSSTTNSSLLLGAFVKRSKRAIQNVDRHLLTPIVRKALWRYMQYAPRRYPTDFSFQVRTTLGIVAREVEQLNLTQLMAMLPEEMPQVSVAVAKGIIELANVQNKAEILQAMTAAMQPPSEEEQQRALALQEMEFERIRAETQGVLLENQKTIAETRKLLAEATKAARQADNDDDKVSIEQHRLMLQAQENQLFAQQNEIAQRRLELQERALQIRAKQSNKSS